MKKIKSKNKSKKAKIKKQLIIFLGVFFVLALIISSLIFTLYLLSIKEKNTIYTSKHEDKIYWNRLFKESEKDDFIMSPNAVIVPHDLILDTEIQKFFNGLKEAKNPEKILLLIPNQENVGNKSIITCDKCIFKNHEGLLNIDFELIDLMKKNNILYYSDLAFKNEDAFLNIAPFIKNSFPNAEIIPVLINENLSKDEIIKFRTFISSHITTEDLIISSMNFSENELLQLAELNDLSSLNTINNFDFDNVLDLDVEMPSSLYLLMNILDHQECKNVEVVKSFDLNDSTDENLDYTDTFKFIAFNYGENLDKKGVSIMSFGNINNDYDQKILNSWVYDPNYNSNSDLSDGKFLKNLRSQKDKFFNGIDYIVFDLDDESCVNYKQNSFTVSFCKYKEKIDNETGELLDLNFDFIDSYKEDSDFVYLLYEFKDREITNERKKEIKVYSSDYADLFIGRGLNNLYEIDYYDDTVFIYSLQDFMTNSKLATSLTADSEGIVLGSYIDEKEIKLYFIPIKIDKGYPTLKDFNLRKSIFSEIISKSNLPLASFEINSEKGYISIPR